MVWVNLIAIIILATALFKQHSDTEKSVKKTNEIIFNLKDSLQKEIFEIGAKADELKTKLSILDPDVIVKRIKEIREEIEQSSFSRFEQIEQEMKKLRKLLENYLSKIEGKVSLIDKIGQKVSQITSSFEEKLKALLGAKKTEK